MAATQPVALEAPQLGGVFNLSDGIVRVYGGLKRGQRYTATATRHARSRPILPVSGPCTRRRSTGSSRSAAHAREPFGAAGRDARVDLLFGDERYLALWPYKGLWNEAKRLRAGARTPYGAVVAIETWLRSTGSFEYDESPPPPTAGLPPLAHFVTEGKRGYCQHFAGAMALMLRFLGIPRVSPPALRAASARTAAGPSPTTTRTRGSRSGSPGTAGSPFDPTPGRGALAATYSVSSSGFNAGDAADAFGPRRGGADRGQRARPVPAEGAAGGARSKRARARGGRGGPRTIWLLLALVLVVGGAIGAPSSSGGGSAT